jgi:hypothetical protein
VGTGVSLLVICTIEFSAFLKIELRAGPTDRTCCCCSGVPLAPIVLLLAVVTKELGPDAIVCAVIGFIIAYDDDAEVHKATIIADIIPYSINLFLVMYTLRFETKSILNFASKALCLTITCYIFPTKNIIRPTKK